ncbi:MAG: flagellar motor protein MotB [Bacillota bacterium]
MPRFNRKRRSDNGDNGGSPAWMTTFSDMMTLLLVFFVLLYSFSEMDLQKFKGFISSMQNQLGVLEGGRTLSEDERMDQGNIDDRYNPSPENITEVMNEMEQYARENNLQDRMELEVTDRGLVVRLTGQILYDLGEAVIKPEGREVLGEVVDNIDDIPNNIMVEGHTDDLPIDNDRFPSNWELSTTRATNVIKYFIEEHNVDPDRLSAAGYSEHRPLFDNDSPENRSKNRRVEIVILNSQNQDTPEEVNQ